MESSKPKVTEKYVVFQFVTKNQIHLILGTEDFYKALHCYKAFKDLGVNCFFCSLLDLKGDLQKYLDLHEFKEENYEKSS